MNPQDAVKVDARLLPQPGKSRTAIYDPELKRLRAVQMLQARVAGYSLKDVARMFQVSENTVDRTLTYARRAGILVEASDAILERMVPLAQDAILSALQAPEDEVDKVTKANIGMKIFEGTGLLGNKGKPSGGHGGDTALEDKMHELRQRAELLAATTEGEILSDASQRQLPAAAEHSSAGAGQEDLQYETEISSSPEADRLRLDAEATAASAAENVSADDLGRPAESKLS